MRNAKRMLAAVERIMPGLSRREWGALAIAAARRAGLEDPEANDLRRNLELAFANAT